MTESQQRMSSVRSCIKNLRNGARVREVYGRKREGIVEAFDLETGHVKARLDVIPLEEHRHASHTWVRILIRDFVRGNWTIDP